jgi:hypothetical protein
MTIHLASPGNIRLARASGVQWVFLGKGSALRSMCDEVLGSANCFDVTDRFHGIARELRQPFLDFVVAVGEEQQDRLGWFSSSFAWKDPDASDLFLLICYLKLLESLATDPKSESLLVLIEDRWLYAQSLLSLSGPRGDVDFGSAPRLWPTKVLSLMRGLAGRAIWMLRIIREYVSNARHRRRYDRRGKHDTWMYSLPHPRCFDGQTRWNDPFFGKLDAILGEAGYSVGRLIPPDALGFASEIAQRAGYVYPIILELSAGRLVTSLMAVWRARLKSVPRVDGLDVSQLALREWWMDFGRALWCQHRLLYECALQAMKAHHPTTLIFPYENQPWEKMLVSAAREVGVRSIGYQHSTVPRFLLSYFFGRNEAASLPLPDVILTTGRQQARLLIEGGTPAARTAVAGSLRYQHVHRAEGLSGVSQRGETATKRVLVVTSHDLSLTSSLLRAIESAFPDHGQASGLSLFYKPHPTLQAVRQTAASWMTSVTGDLTPQLSAFDVVVTAATTVGLEAFFLGIPVIKYRADVLIDLDPMDALPEGTFITASHSDLRQRIEQAALAGRREVSTEVSGVRSDLFPAVDVAMWISALSGSAARSGAQVAPLQEDRRSRRAEAL